MSNYKLWNNILAWITFAVAAFTYLSTMEPTASFWDCGEFIATADKLLVGHPPGAPFFMIMGRVFALFASGPDKVAMMINSMSALSSAFTILFLFWTITYLAKKLLVGNAPINTLSKGQAFSILGSGLIGALAYTFTDTFWFSAVEGEVYAMSSLFTAVVFWAILKWDAEADEAHSKRWIILIGFLVGLSIGVHLLNLLAIPAIALVYYFRKHKVTTMGIIITLALSFAILMFIMYGIVPGTVKLASIFELMFVNGFGLPFNSGMVFFYIALAAALIFGIRYTYNNNKELANTALTLLTVIFIGYSAFAMVLIRANAQPPMNQNDPKDAFSLYSYLNREQYGDRPLFYGQYYSAPIVGQEEDGKIRAQKGDKYEVVDTKPKYIYDERFETLFPRMYSSQDHHISQYQKWAKIKGTKINTKEGVKIKPTYAENIRFLFSYQLNYMYWRYFMWNFAGRQNDKQGHGGVTNGNWISGINFIDQHHLGGDWSKLPDSIKEDKAHNKYYFLPLILGILGIIFQINKGKKDKYQNLLIVGALFVLTGIAIVIYLNQYPMQPRERDYAYAASFYAFCIWIGLGVLYLTELMSKVVKSEYAAVAATAISLVVPGILAAENWDDHDRSNRYMCRDFANNYLQSCEENAIIFTNGDNDTFPLWYAQEVEGIRTDVRVCNLSYLQTDWYINQMRKQAYKSEGLPFTLDKEDTQQGRNGITYLIDRVGGKSFDLENAFKWLASDKKETKEVPGHGKIDHFPAKKFHLSIDKEEILSKGIVNKVDSARIIDKIDFDFSKKNYIRKNKVMMMDLIATANWDRPIYIAVSVPTEYHIGLTEHFETTGLAYHLVPMKTKNNSIFPNPAEINTEVMYDNMMNKFQFGGMSTKGVYMEENTMRMSLNYRLNFVRLAGALYKEGKLDKARKAIERSFEEVPSYNIPYSYMSYQLIDICLKLDMKDKAIEVLKETHHTAKQELDFFLSYDVEDKNGVSDKIRENMMIYQNLIKYSKDVDSELFETAKSEFEAFYPKAAKML